MASSPQRGEGTLQEQLEWYKTQYAQLETDLADFQASSKELEEQLEKDVETAEKNERKWKAQVEKLSFEGEEWKTKHKQAKAEANSAQNALQKEITMLRDSQRTLQLQLRDTEVMNDDYERQARNTESSLEDLESRHNMAIERSVMLETEVKQGEQEREALRIELQRLRDELSDLKVENEITLEKLRLADATIDGIRTAKPSPLAVDHLRPRSPGSEASGMMTPLSPTASTPPPKSDAGSDAPTPPSPPLSDAPAHFKTEQRTPVPAHRRGIAPDSTITPRPSSYGVSRATARHSRGPSTSSITGGPGADSRNSRGPINVTRQRPSRPTHLAAESNLPRSDSLYQIRGLIGRMQKIEERVHSARSKLPGPSGLTPRGSPRSASSSLVTDIPNSVTMRRHMKRPSGSLASSVLSGDEGASNSEDQGSRHDSHVKRLSFGLPRPMSRAGGRSDAYDRPPSAMDYPRPPSAMSRPGSRASMASGSHRPASRAGARTADYGKYTHHQPAASLSSTSSSGLPGRSRSSMGGEYATPSGTMTPRTHRTSASISELRKRATASADSSEDSAIAFPVTPSNNRRLPVDKSMLSAIPTPSAIPRRQSNSALATHHQPPPPHKTLKRTSSNFMHVREEKSGDGEMRPPPNRKRNSDIGETY